jgi:ATP-dependent Clp endopeptidase proteolytic subunit ClpP
MALMVIPKNFSHSNTLADNEPQWSSVDKGALPRAAFADQGEADKKSTWKYPHHWVKNGGNPDSNGVYTTGTMYLHKGGLNAAWSAAQGGRSGEEAPAAVKSHLEEHRKALGLDDLASGYSVKMQASGDAEIYIYEEIGEGWFGGVSANQFAKDIKALAEPKNITLRLNSPGGDVFDGIAIYNILKLCKSKITVMVDGVAASIAAVIAMAGNEIIMAENAMMMIHNAWGMQVGTAEDMRKMADLLEKTNVSIRDTFASRTGLSAETIANLMAGETWMSSKECKEYGFADTISENIKIAAYFDFKKFHYRNVPVALAAAQNSDIRARLARLNLKSQQYRIASNPKN